MITTLRFDSFKNIFEATERKKWDLYDGYPYYKCDSYERIEVCFPNFIEKCKYWFWRFRFLHEEKKRRMVQSELNSLEIFKNDISKLKEKRDEAIQKDLEEVKEIMSTPVPTSIELTLENLEEKYKAEDKKKKEKDKARPVSIHDIVNQNFEDKLKLLSTCGVKSDEFIDEYTKMIDALQNTKEPEGYKGTTYPIIEVLNYMLKYAWDNSNSSNENTNYLYQVTTLQYLEKVLYIMQLVYINRYNKPLFFSEIEVNCNGPVIPDLRHYQITYALCNYAKEEYRYYYDINNFWNYRVDKIANTLSEEDKAFIREWWHNDIIKSFSYLKQVVNSHDIIKQGQTYYTIHQVPKKLTIEAMRQEGKELVVKNGKIHL